MQKKEIGSAANTVPQRKFLALEIDWKGRKLLNHFEKLKNPNRTITQIKYKNQ